MELLLEITEGGEAGRHVPLSHSLEIGRDPGVAIALNDAHVSWRHARIDTDEGGAKVHDLGSKNGTYVNDQPIGGSQLVSPGDRIRLGLTVLELRTREQVARHASVVGPSPEITQLGHDVLRPVRAERLPSVGQPGPSVPGFLVEESEPAFVPHVVFQGGEAGAVTEDGAKAQSYEALVRLVDARVKHQTSTAAFAVLASAGLAVLIFFGAR